MVRTCGTVGEHSSEVVERDSRDGFIWSVSFIWFVSFKQTNQMDQRNHPALALHTLGSVALAGHPQQGIDRTTIL